MDSVLTKHLASAFLLPKKENVILANENDNYLKYHSCKLIDNQYYIKLDNDVVVSENKGYWKNKPIIEYNNNKYILLENSNSLVNLDNVGNDNKDITIKPKEIIKEKNPPVKKKEPKLISIPLNKPSTASYITTKATNEDREEKKETVNSNILETLDKHKDDPRVKNFFNYHTELAKKEIFAITEKFAQQQMSRAMESGGGTNAVQYANGGTMNGDLIIDGNLTVTGSITNSGLAKKTFLIGNNSDTEFTVTHNLGTKDLSVTLYDNTDEIVLASVKNISSNETKITFNIIIPINGIKVVIIG